MWAIIVDDGSGGSKIDSIIDRAKTFTNPNNDITYGPEIFSLWSDSERWAIGIAKVNAGTEPDQKFYTRGTPSYAIASAGVVTETIPKTAIALATLKTKYTEQTKQNGHTMIKRYSWLAERKTFSGTAVPSAVTSHVAAIVSASQTICTAIDDCGNLNDFMALWTVPESGNAPIDDWPTASNTVAAYKRI